MSRTRGVSSPSCGLVWSDSAACLTIRRNDAIKIKLCITGTISVRALPSSCIMENSPNLHLCPHTAESNVAQTPSFSPVQLCTLGHSTPAHPPEVGSINVDRCLFAKTRYRCIGRPISPFDASVTPTMFLSPGSFKRWSWWWLVDVEVVVEVVVAKVTFEQAMPCSTTQSSTSKSCITSLLSFLPHRAMLREHAPRIFCGN